MGLGGISIWQLVVILVIVILIFGTKKLKGMGSDIGGAVKGFKSAVKGDEAVDDEAKKIQEDATIDTASTVAKESAEKTAEQKIEK
jgi:sec-independent protein translocase protein TatA